MPGVTVVVFVQVKTMIYFSFRKQMDNSNDQENQTDGRLSDNSF